MSQPPNPYNNDPNQPWNPQGNPQWNPPGQQQWNPGSNQQWNGGYQQAPPQQPYGFPPYNPFLQGKIDLPNSGGVLACGIVGLCVFLSIIGLICSIVAIVLASQAIGEYQRTPERYTESSLSRVKAGRTCGIIGLCIYGLAILIIIIAIIADA